MYTSLFCICFFDTSFRACFTLSSDLFFNEYSFLYTLPYKKCFKQPVSFVIYIFYCKAKGIIWC